MMSSSSCWLSERSVGSLETCRRQLEDPHWMDPDSHEGQGALQSPPHTHTPELWRARIWADRVPPPTLPPGLPPQERSCFHAPHPAPSQSQCQGPASQFGAGRALTLVNWCTMMCRQCRFMSSACVLSAASRIWNSRFLEGLLPLSATAPPQGFKEAHGHP